MVDGKLLAHELGHLFGSNHDGQKGGAACQQNVNIMSPIVNPNMVSYSDCTRKMIDEEDEKRKRQKEDCLFT